MAPFTTGMILGTVKKSVPAPALTSVSPTSGLLAGGITLTLTGTNLSTATAVTFAGSSVAFTVVNNTTITLTDPSHTAGAVAITVTTPSGTSSSVSFTYLASGGIAATRTFDFIDSLAVDVHMQYGGPYSPPSGVLTALQYLGIHHVRDFATTSSWTSSFSSLGAAGIKLNTGYGSNDSDYGAQGSTATQQALANAAYIASIEGPNEVNFSTPNPSNGLSTPQQIQAYIWTMIHSNASLANAKSVCFSVSSGRLSDFQAYGDNSANCDFANAHIYFGNGAQPYQNLHDFGSPLTVGDCPNRPVFITETGYTTATIQQGGNQAVSQNVAARCTLNMYMDCWLLGYKRTFKYELFDEGTDGGQESNYGFFFNNKTPKPVATAVQSMTTIMADAGGTAATFAPGSLAYTVTGLPGTGHSLLFQKSNGSFVVAIWAEPQIWDSSNMTEITPSTSSVTLNLGQTVTTVQVYDPIIGTTVQTTLSNVSSVSLSITDHPLLIVATP